LTRPPGGSRPKAARRCRCGPGLPLVRRRLATCSRTGCRRHHDRAVLEGSDDLVEVFVGEPVAAADPAERDPALAGLFLDPPVRAAEGLGNVTRFEQLRGLVVVAAASAGSFGCGSGWVGAVAGPAVGGGHLVLLAVRLRSSEWLGLGRPCIRAAGSVGERAGVVVTVRVLPGGGHGRAAGGRVVARVWAVWRGRRKQAR
jgi:hypothetical protein